MTAEAPQRLSGIHVAVVTPFHPDGSVNVDVAHSLIDSLIDNGVQGIVSGASTGEGPMLTRDERRCLLLVAIDAARDRVPVTAQIGALTTREAIDNAEVALASGAAIGLLPPPYYEPMTEDELFEHVKAVAAVGLPIMVYNNPSAVGWSISPALLARLAQIEGVRYLKDTIPDAARLFEIELLSEGRLQVLSGQDSLALLSFLGGATATVWGAPNATPHACVELYHHAVVRSDVDSARHLWKRLYPVMRFFETEGYVASVKAATARRGHPVGPPRLPALPLSPTARERLATLVAALESYEREQPTAPRGSTSTADVQ